MRTFLIKLAAFISLQVLLLGVLVGFFYNTARDRSFEYATNIKHARLADAPSPRAIFIGGSNVYFGLDGDLIREQTPYYPINMGMVGALRLKYMLTEVNSSLRPGDIVVLALEYPQMYQRFEDSSRSTIVLARVFSARPQTMQHWSREHWRAMLDSGAATVLGESVRAAVDNLGAVLRGKGLPEIKPVANEYGDLVTLRHMEPRADLGTPFAPDDLTSAPIDAHAAMVNRFVRDCEARGVEVIFTYPPIPQPSYDAHHEALAQFDLRLREKLRCPVVQMPGDMVFPRHWFYNTSYHLTGPGVPARTQKMIDLLSARPWDSE